jgi:predicted phage terminase large subunit-like protein
LKILVLSYTEDLAEWIARCIRSVLQADWFKKLFDARIQKGHAKAMNFRTTAGGELRAMSIHGSVTGFGADFLVVDDPHNTSEAASSKQLRETIELFHKNGMTRLNNPKSGRIIVIGHRIHEDDLSAHLLNAGGWRHVVLPIIATREQTYETAYGPWTRRQGDLLQPGAYDMQHVNALRANLHNPDFDMLYQQDVDAQAWPAITAEHFPCCTSDQLQRCQVVISIDAGTDEGASRSFSVIQVWKYDGQNHFLVEQFRERCDFHDLARATRHLARRHAASSILIEQTANGPALKSELTKNQRKRVVGIIPRGSKTSRLRRHIDKIIAGRIRLMSDAPFRSDFVRELVKFPHGRHNDQVDGLTQYLDWIDKQGPFDVSKAIGPQSLPMAVALNSQRTVASQPKVGQPGARGVMASAGNSNLLSNGPFVTAKAWVRY